MRAFRSTLAAYLHTTTASVKRAVIWLALTRLFRSVLAARDHPRIEIPASFRWISDHGDDA